MQVRFGVRLGAGFSYCGDCLRSNNTACLFWIFWPTSDLLAGCFLHHFRNDPRSGLSCAAALILVTLLSRHFRTLVFDIFISHFEHADTLAFDPSIPPSPPSLHDTVIPLDRLACRSLKSCALPHPASGAHRRQPGPQSWGVLNSGILDFPDSVERLFSPMATSTHFFQSTASTALMMAPKGRNRSAAW